MKQKTRKINKLVLEMLEIIIVRVIVVMDTSSVIIT